MYKVKRVEYQLKPNRKNQANTKNKKNNTITEANTH